MRRALLVVVTILCQVCAGVFDIAAQSATENVVHAVLMKSKDGEPATKFLSDSPKIYASWKGRSLKAGDRVHVVWIAENVGYPALNGSRIREGSVTVYKPDDDGVFSLVRPKEGWPLGKYRLEVYVGSKLIEALKFTIEAGAIIEVR